MVYRVLLLVLFIVLIASLAQAHQTWAWIGENNIRNPVTGQSCCGKTDCYDLHPLYIVRDGDDYRITLIHRRMPKDQMGKIVRFPADQVQASQDGRPWVCIPRFATAPRCVFMYQGS